MKAIMINANADNELFMTELNTKLNDLKDKEVDVNYSTCYSSVNDEIAYSAVIVVRD